MPNTPPSESVAPPAPPAPPDRPLRRSRALSAFPWVLLACALLLFGFAAYIALRYAQAASGAGGAGMGGGGVWGQFSVLMGGIIGPALGFLTVVALAMTLILQLNAAAEVRRAADVARHEADIRARQAFLGAKLSALTTLVDAANHEIYRTGGSVLVEQRQAWEERKQGFLVEMDATFAALAQLDPALRAGAPAEPTA